jgi:DNA repair protein RadC
MVRETPATYRITDMLDEERPRERLAAAGAGSLNKAELIAILLRVGMEGENAIQLANRLLLEMHGLIGIQRASFSELCSFKGLGPAKAAQLKAAIELGKRMIEEGMDPATPISSPAQAADLVRYEMQGLTEEHLRVILLDTRNRKIDIDPVSKGSLNTAHVRIGELFRAAVQRNAASIIMVHNHPSGDPMPSPEDVALTRGAVQAGKLLDIEVLDHLVIGSSGFVSLKEKGLGFA